MKKLKELLYNANDETVYIAEYHYWNDGKKLRTCKTCTVVEFLRELTEFKSETMVQVIKNAKFRRF